MSTVLTLNGAFVLGDVMPLWLRGSVTFGNAVHTIAYNNFDVSPAGIAGGVELLNTAINGIGGVKVGFGHSEGARIIYDWMWKYGEACTVDPANLSFVCTGNPQRKYGGVPWLPRLGLPDSCKYDVRDFSRQYDGWCDWPNALNANRNALLNAVWGMLFGVHTNYFSVASGDVGNLTHPEVHTGGGTVTYEYSPTKPLPIISTFWSTSTSGQDAAQRPRVEAAYDRPVDIPPPTYL